MLGFNGWGVKLWAANRSTNGRNSPTAEWLGPKLLPDTRGRLAFKPNMYPVTQRVATTIFEVFIYYLRPPIH